MDGDSSASRIFDPPPPPDSPRSVFVSHNSRDADVALQIVTALELADISCWIAPRNIPAGSDYNAAITHGLAAAAAFVLVYSRHAVESDPVTREVDFAVARRIPVIPVRLDQSAASPALRYLIRTFQWVDAFPPPVGRHLDSIVAGVKRALDIACEVPSSGPGAPLKDVGPYRLLELIGEGGMGTVYKAEQRSPVKRIVALKVVKPGPDTQEVLARFESERQALARLNHPHIATVLDAGTDALGRPYFAMEYVPGNPITRFADENKNSRFGSGWNCLLKSATPSLMRTRRPFSIVTSRPRMCWHTWRPEDQSQR